MNPKKHSTKIETTHDISNLLGNLVEGPDCSDLIAFFLQGPPLDIKKCPRCGRVLLAALNYDTVLRNGDGYRYFCKSCRRKTHAAQGRRRRVSKKAMRNPTELEEIQRHRSVAGLKPLPLGPDSPKAGRPPNGTGLFGSTKFTLEEAS